MLQSDWLALSISPGGIVFYLKNKKINPSTLIFNIIINLPKITNLMNKFIGEIITCSLHISSYANLYEIYLNYVSKCDAELYNRLK